MNENIITFLQIAALTLGVVGLLAYLLFRTKTSSQHGLEEGKTVTCGGVWKVFRYTNNTLRHYPSAAVAASWNPAWREDIIDLPAEMCSTIAQGEPMSMR